jgi:hypothetical protein
VGEWKKENKFDEELENPFVIHYSKEVVIDMASPRSFQ